MAMAIPALVLVILALGAQADDDQDLLNQINQYRSNLGLSLLTSNKGASCLADKLVDRFENQECNNITQAQTTADGLEPNFPEYPNMVKDCKLQLQNTTKGQILVDCVPKELGASAVATVFQNITRSQKYQGFINSSDYVSAGVASEDLWFVVVLATGHSDGNFAQSTSGSVAVVASGGLVSLTLVLALFVCWVLAEKGTQT